MTAKKIIFLFLLLIAIKSYSQPDLNKKISVNAYNKSLSEVLKIIEKKADLNFAYNPEDIDDKRKITLQVEKLPVKKILDKFEKDLNLNYVVISNHIILRKKILSALPEQTETAITETEPKYTISGYIRDSATDEALIGAFVKIKGKINTAVMTNAYGFYSITLPKGKYFLEFRFLGYENKYDTIGLFDNLILNKKLKIDEEELKIVLVSPENRQDLIKKTSLRTFGISKLESVQNPLWTGDYDVVKSLSAVPGCIPAGEMSVFFNFRGGAKGQNILYLDEAPIYNPSHLFGFFSNIAPQAVKKINFYKNYFPPDMGNSVSSITEVRTKDGNMQKFALSGNITPVLFSFTTEFPLKKNKISILTTYRKSMLKWLISKINKDLNSQFSDFHFKINWKPNNKNHFFIAFYNGKDIFEIPDAGVNWRNSTLTFRYNKIFGKKLFSVFTLFFSSYNYEVIYSKKNSIRWLSQINNSGLKYDFTYYLNPQIRLKSGLSSELFGFNPGNLYYGQYYIERLKPGNALKNNIYFSMRYKTSKLEINAAIRLNMWQNTGKATVFLQDENYNVIDTFYNSSGVFNTYLNPEIRTDFQYFANKNLGFDLNFSKNVQYIYLITNNLSPVTVFDVWLPANPNLKPMQVYQSGGGLSFVNDLAEADFQIFYRKFENQYDFTSQPSLFLNPLLESEIRTGTAQSYGFEFTLKKSGGRINFLLNYVFSHVKMNIKGVNNDRPYFANWDRPHNLYLSLNIFPQRRLTTSVAWVFISGMRFSSPTGFFRFGDFSVPLYDEKNNDRLPDYHRLDISIRYRLNKNTSRRFSHFITLSLFNVYNRKNVILVNFNNIEIDGKPYPQTNYIQEAEFVPSAYYSLPFVFSISYVFELL